MKRDYATYHVGLKILLKKGRSVLFLTISDKEHYLDLPGGRIDNVESNIPLEKILAREICEELGPSVRYLLGQPVFQFRRYVPSRKIYNFLTVYEGEYISGKIKLSFEHDSFEWINPKVYRFKKMEFINQEEYLAFKKYFQK